MTEPVEREEVHRRQVDLRFYKRSDGLFEVIGRLVDTKSHPFRRQLAVHDSPPGTPLHDIRVHLVFDESLVVHDAFAEMEATPFAICPGALGALASLKGSSMGAGWNKRVRELLGGPISCTHISELLGPMATTAFQGLAPQRLAALNIESNLKERQQRVDSCYAYAAHRDVVAQLWPELHQPRQDR